MLWKPEVYSVYFVIGLDISGLPKAQSCLLNTWLSKVLIYKVHGEADLVREIYQLVVIII